MSQGVPETRPFETNDGTENDVKFNIKEALIDPKLKLSQDFIRKKRHYGNQVICIWYKDEPCCTLGPHWAIFLLSWLVIITVGVLVYIFVASKTSAVIQTITIALFVWEVLIYLYLALKNQGIVTCPDPTDPSIYELAKQPEFCSRCKVLRAKNIFHCKDCNVCIRDHHHHCSWIGKCVGAGNITAFYIFIVSTIVYFLFCGGLTLYEAIEAQI